MAVILQDYVMLTKWLPPTPSTLPPNASHQVGVGAFVVNERGEVLVVQENSGILRGKGVWKMPTGLVHAGRREGKQVFENWGCALGARGLSYNSRRAAATLKNQGHGLGSYQWPVGPKLCASTYCFHADDK